MVKHDVGDYVYDDAERLGKGSFGKVYRGHRKQDESEKVAVKVINRQDSNVKRAESNIQKEIEISKETVHKNLVAFKFCTRIEFKTYIVMECCNGGNLFEYLKVKETLTKPTIRAFFKQIGTGLKFLHSKDIIHRDLKPENVLLNFDGQRYPEHENILLKIGDFGLGRFLPPNEKAGTKCGTPYYMAPEIASGKHDKKVDLWSIGMMIYECLVGSAKAAASDSVTMPDDFTQDLKELLTGLLKLNPEERFDCDGLMNHSFMSEKIQISILAEKRTRGMQITKTSSVGELYESVTEILDSKEQAGTLVLYHEGQPLARGSSVEDASVKSGSNITVVYTVSGGIYRKNQTRTSDKFCTSPLTLNLL